MLYDNMNINVKDSRELALLEQIGQKMISAEEYTELQQKQKETQESLDEMMKAFHEHKEEIAAQSERKFKFVQDNRREEFTESDIADAYFHGNILNCPTEGVSEKVFNTPMGLDIREKAITSVSAFTQSFSTTVQKELEQALTVGKALPRIRVDAKTFDVPVAGEDTDSDVSVFASGTYATSPSDTTRVPPSNQHTISSVSLTPNKFMVATHLATDEEEDTLLPLIPFLRQSSSRRLGRALEAGYTRGTNNLAGFTANIDVSAYDSPFAGIATLLNDASLTTNTAGATTYPTPANVGTARAAMGKYGVDPKDLVLFLSTEAYLSLVQDTSVTTVDKIGDAYATLLKGSLAAIYGVRIEIAPFLDAATEGAYPAMLVYTPGFIIGERRDVVVQSAYEPRQQCTSIYLSTRVDMSALTTVASAALDSTWTMGRLLISTAG